MENNNQLAYRHCGILFSEDATRVIWNVFNVRKDDKVNGAPILRHDSELAYLFHSTPFWTLFDYVDYYVITQLLLCLFFHERQNTHIYVVAWRQCLNVYVSGILFLVTSEKNVDIVCLYFNALCCQIYNILTILLLIINNDYVNKIGIKRRSNVKKNFVWFFVYLPAEANSYKLYVIRL